MVITVKCTPQPICLINAYLPPKGSPDFKLTFDDHLDQIFEITQKYQDHILILGGDLNGSITAPKYPHDFILKSALEALGLHLHDNYPASNTFQSHNGSTRHLDYFVTSHTNLLQVSHPTTIPENTSAHSPVIANLNLTLDFCHIDATETPLSNRVNWEKADLFIYKNEACKGFQELDLNADLDKLNTAITSALAGAALKAAPRKKKPKRISKVPITPYVKSQIANCRKVHTQGPKKSSASVSAARKALRKAIRMENARQRKRLYEDLMSSNESHDSIMHKLIARQRGSKRLSHHALKIDGQIVNDEKGLLKAWANHFHHLGTPTDLPHYNTEHKRRITATKQCISDYIMRHKPYETAPPITTEEVHKAIKKLNPKKAADKEGLTAEHLKHGSPHILPALAAFFNKILLHGLQPADFNNGVLNPVLKKGKDFLDPNNSRGIVISPILSKTYEHIINKRESADDTTDPLQFGFTEDRSPTMASLTTTEAIAECLDQGKPVYIASLDSAKAFDVVWQDSLAVRIFLKKPPEYWLTHTKLLEDTQLEVKLGDQYSEPFKVDQGVGQGKILSTKNYKDYIEPVLSLHRRSKAGTRIGIYFVGSPTCADDVLLICSTPEALQEMLEISHQFACQERFNIHPLKTKVIIINHKGPTSLHEWTLGGTVIRPSPLLCHLGINRYANSFSSDDLINDRIVVARRTAFSLLGAGLHGSGGINNPTMKKIMEVYVIPRLLYALESLIVTQKQKEALDVFFRDLLKRLQALPQRTANEAPYLLFGMLPAEALLDIRTLIFLGKIMGDHSSILHQVCIRQLATKSISSNSWFITVTKLCYKYNLPSPHLLLQSCFKMPRWKKLVKQRVSEYWKHQLASAAEDKPTLRLICNSYDPAWKNVDLNTHAVARARLQARLLTDTLTLQYHNGKFYNENPLCKLCHTEEETRLHMLVRCRTLSETRLKMIQPIFERMQELGWGPPSDDEDMLRLILGVHRSSEDRRIHNLASNACFAITHRRHNFLLQPP